MASGITIAMAARAALVWFNYLSSGLLRIYSFVNNKYGITYKHLNNNMQR
jgi:hypothetical protein